MSRQLEGDIGQTLLDAAWSDLGQLTVETGPALSLEAKRDRIELIIDQIVVDPATGRGASHTPTEKRVRIRWR